MTHTPRRLLVPAAATLLVTALWSCWLPAASSSSRLLDDHTTAPPEIRTACAVTEKKCTRCHTVDRIVVAKVTTAFQWSAYVDRMRRMAGSGITHDDGDVILRCLVYRWETRRESR